jgi:hypothetical protein
MKQTATNRNKKQEQTQLARARRPRGGFHRPPGLPPQVRSPRTQRIYDFISGYVQHSNVMRAATDAGYTEEWGKKKAYAVLKEYEAYVSYLQKLVTEERVKILAIDTQSVLDEIARIGLINEFDYLVIEDVEIREDGKTKIVRRARRKELHELTRDEMVGIRVVRKPDGSLTYDLRDKDPMLLALGKNLGLFNEKLIIERRNFNLNARMDLSNVPTEQLLQIIQSFEKVAEESGHGRIIEAK